MIAILLTAVMQSDLPDQSKVAAAFNAAKGKVRVVMLVSPT